MLLIFLKAFFNALPLYQEYPFFRQGNKKCTQLHQESSHNLYSKIFSQFPMTEAIWFIESMLRTSLSCNLCCNCCNTYLLLHSNVFLYSRKGQQTIIFLTSSYTCMLIFLWICQKFGYYTEFEVTVLVNIPVQCWARGLKTHLFYLWSSKHLIETQLPETSAAALYWHGRRQV